MPNISQSVSQTSRMMRKTAKIAADGLVSTVRAFDFKSFVSVSPFAGVFELEPPKSVIAPETMPTTVVITALVVPKELPLNNPRRLIRNNGPNITKGVTTTHTKRIISVQAPHRAHHS